jgi:UrcA family protein
MNRFLAPACALVFASLTVASDCVASPVDGDGVLVRNLRVRYADLDLSKAVGIKALNRRIEYALNLVCVAYTGPSVTGTIDPDCQSDGRRAVQQQVVAAIAKQKSATQGAESNFSIAGEKPDAIRSPIL